MSLHSTALAALVATRPTASAAPGAGGPHHEGDPAGAGFRIAPWTTER